MTTKTAIPSPSEVAASPQLFAKHFIKIMDKQDRLIPLIFNPVQTHYLANRTSRDIILKPRQKGITTAIQSELFRYNTTRPSRTLTLANDDTNTQKLRRMTDRFYDKLPDDFRPKRGQANASITTYPLIGSECAIATAGNREAGRAGSYRFIHCSEAAFFPDLESIVASALQAGTPQWVALESTANGAQGYFYQLCMEALAGDSTWKLHFYPWFFDSEYQLPLIAPDEIQFTDEEGALVEKHGLIPEQIKWRRAKQKEVKEKFRQEYPEDPITCFLSSGNSVFGEFQSALYTPKPDDHPIADHEYVGGIDWGQSKNYTALSIIDATDNREVVLWRKNQTRWDEMRREMTSLCDYWHVGHLYVEKNSASSNVEAIRDEIEQLQTDKDRPLTSVQTSVIAFNTTNKRKAEMVNTLYQGIHEDGLKLLDILYATAELRQYQSVQTAQGVWTYDCPETPDGAHGDTVIARMAAYWGSMRRMPSEW